MPGVFTWLPKFGVCLICLGVLALDEVAAGGCVTPDPNLISWWRAEGDATDALNVNNGTLQGGVTFAPGEVGQAFSFNGLNTAVQIPDSAGLDFASNAPMTIELWAYRTGAETTMYLIGKRNTNCGSVQYEMGFDPYNGLAFTAGNGSVLTGVQMPTNEWVHLAATFDGTNTFHFYTNGTLAAIGSGNLGPPNSGPLIIGNSSVCAGFAGLIDEVSIYGRALSPATIQGIYAAGSSGKCVTPPSITAQPQSQKVLLGETVTLSVAAGGGTPPYSYQWQMDGTNISGATTNPLVLSGVQSSQTGSYAVVVRGVGASILSSNAVLTVATPVPGQVVVIDQAGLLSGLASAGHVTFAGDGAIGLSQTVVITRDTILDASGHSVTISGNNTVQVFLVESGVQFTLKNLTIVNGRSTGAVGADGAAGGLYNAGGTVTVLQCGFFGNAAVGGVGGAGGNGGNATGGAIYNDLGSLNISNSSFLSNSAAGGAIGNGGTVGGSSYGGAIFNNGGTMALAGSTFLHNASVGGYGGTGLSGDAFGGAVHTSGGILNVMESTFTGNDSSSGTVGGTGVSGIGGSSLGGALSIVAGNVTVINGGFYSNNAASPAAGAEAAGCTAGPAFGGGIYQASGTLNLIATTLATNNALGGSGFVAYAVRTANGYGGALFNAGTLNSTNCDFYGNNASGGSNWGPADAYGGAIFNQGAANLILTTLSGNEALGGWGGFNPGPGLQGAPSGGGNGGGIFNRSFLLLLGCTLSQNTAVGPAVVGTGGAGSGGAGGSSFGGGIYNLGICLATNDTIIGNSATGGSPGNNAGGSANGGGFFNQGGTVTLAYLTVFSNSAVGGLGSPNGPGVGGGVNATNGSLLLLDSIVAGNPSGSDFYASFGAITDGGDNLSSDISFPFSAPGSRNNTLPQLGLLGQYGGPTQTLPLLAGSPAIDAAGAGGCPDTDQRGVARPAGGACDIGAYEYAPAFSIQGQVRSIGPTGSITVSAGVWSSATDSEGNYVLNGVAAGTYSVTPSSSTPGIYFSPSHQTISIGPNATNVNFVAFLLNSLTASGYSNGVLQLSFGGTNGQTEVVEVSTDLLNWIPVSTIVLSSNGLLPFSLTNIVVQPKEFVRTRTP